MSRNVSIFVKHSDISQVVACVSRFIGHALDSVESVTWELYSACAFGLSLSIFRAEGFEDDKGMQFRRYSVVVDLQSADPLFMLATTQQFRRSMSLLLASRLVNTLNCECMIVEDYQSLLAIML